MTANSVQAAPAGISIATAAAVKGSAATASTLTLAKGVLKIMAWSKTSTAIAVAAAVVLTTSISVVIVKNARLIQGRTEDEWIKSIVYNGDDTQTRRWMSLGPAGVKMLTKALLSPDRDRATRMGAASLLTSEIAAAGILGSDATRQRAADPLAGWWEENAKRPLPALLRSLQTEKDDGVRGCVLSYFETLLPVMNEKEKAPFLPEFLHAMESKDLSVRNNAMVALRSYPGQAQEVIPVLLPALQDQDVRFRLRAADALVHVDVQTAVKAGVIPILIDILKDPDNQIAWQAALILGDMGPEAAPAVSALIASSHGTDRLVAGQAAISLRRIDPAAATQALVK